MSAKWELGSDLEEHAWRWRQGRMADLGYVDFYEALSIYQWLDPASVKVDEHTFVAPPPETPTELPAVLAGSLDEAGFFGKALATLASDAEVERLHGALVLLINKAMAADLVDPGDFEHGKEALGRAVAYVGLALEYLSRGDAARAGQALLSVALERIFRVGFSPRRSCKKEASTPSPSTRRGTTSCARCASDGRSTRARSIPRRREARATSPRSPTSRGPPQRSRPSQKWLPQKNGNSLRRRHVRRYKRARKGASHSWPTR
jgi:hypothetical protein